MLACGTLPQRQTLVPLTALTPMRVLEMNVCVHGVVSVCVLCTWLAALQGEYAEAVAKLLPLRPWLQSLGGSHAQRDVFDLTTIQAAIQAHQHELAVALLCERYATAGYDTQCMLR